MSCSLDTFYFLCFPNGDKNTIRVIDLSYDSYHKLNSFVSVNEENYYDHLEAIKVAKEMAIKHNLNYEYFDSRYDSSLSESPIESFKRKEFGNDILLKRIDSAPLNESILLFWDDDNHFEKGKIFIEDDVLFHGLSDGESRSENPTHWAHKPVFSFED